MTAVDPLATAAGDEPDDPLDALWSARAVAVVGASERPGAPGRLVLDHLLRYGYGGRVIAVNQRAVAPILGFATSRSVPSGVELAVIVVPASAVPRAVHDCAAAGVRCAIIGSAGFAETGSAGRAMQEDLVATARSADMRLVGPNCIGAVDTYTGLVASFSPLFASAATKLIPGSIGFASASGALGFGAVSLAFDRGLGLLAAVTTGNESDVTALEVLVALARRPECSGVLGYLESLSDAASLRALAAIGKPAALLVAGRSAAGARAVATHTGVLATPDRIVEGVLRQHGIVRAHDVDELLDIGAAFAAPHRPRGNRVAVITTSGGAGALAADTVTECGLTLADLAPPTMDMLRATVPSYGSIANPVDVTATVMSDPSLMATCVAAVAADNGVDALAVCFCVLTDADVDAIVKTLAEVQRRDGKPIVVSRTAAAYLAPAAREALSAAGIPEYLTPARAIRALAALTVAREPRRNAAPVVRVPARAGEVELKRLLATMGVRVPQGSIVYTPEHAVETVRAMGRPAVLKVVVPGLVHKNDVGGVRLDVTPPTAAAVARELLSLPGATGVLVEEMVASGVEALVGIAPTPLGPTLTIGLGGVLAELVDDVAVRLLPVSAADIRDAIAQTRLGPLLDGLRGRRRCDTDDLVSLVETVACDWRGSLDLNPVIVTAGGAIVVDAAYVRDDTDEPDEPDEPGKPGAVLSGKDGQCG